MKNATSQRTPTQSLPVLPGEALRVHSGANLGDPITFAGDLALDDLYRLSPDTVLAPLSLQSSSTGFTIARASKTGQRGAPAMLDCVLTFMSPDGATTDVLLFVELDAQGYVARTHLMPLAPLAARQDYTLVTIDTDTMQERLAQVACVSFMRGTHITLASGEQVRVEDLTVGNSVLTRDSGAQTVRWIGHTTLRAAGPFAPICIQAGVLNNTRDLVVSPDHRLFIYQREDHLGAGRSEVLVKARQLVNGETITVRAGGFVEYYQLLFDAHQIIYAEGIAAESFLIDPRTAPVLPQDAPRAEHRPDYDALDVADALVERSDLADLLRNASGL